MMKELEGTYKPAARKDLHRLELEDGSLLFDREKAAAYTLNSMASLFWLYCDGGTTLEEIAREVSLAVVVEEKKALEDVIKTVSFFREAGLLEPQPEEIHGGKKVV